MSPSFPAPAVRLTALALAAMLAAACTSTDGLFGSDKVDYRSASAKTPPLEVPPDLTQLAREARYQPQSGVVSASAVAAAPTATAAAIAAAPGAAASAPATVALTKMGEIRIERQGQQRWLVVPQTPEQLWPQLRTFWEKNGFTLGLDNPQSGVMETNWSENRAKLPKDAVRNVIGSFVRNLYDTGERDLFRTRVERTEAGSEIFISHRGAQEVFADITRETTKWTARPNDPGLEAEFLSRLMVALSGGTQEAAGGVPSAAPTAVAATAAAAVAGAPEAPARARVLPEAGATALELDEPFDRAWRRVGLALDRGGFTVEDRDRAQGLYFVRYVDPTTAGQEEPSFFSRMFSGNAKDPQTPVRYRIALKGNGPKTTVSVLTSTGTADAGENGKRIAAQLANELK